MTHLKSYIRLTAVLLLFFGSSTAVTAQSATDESDQTFKRVYHTDELDTQASYLITVVRNDNTFGFLSNKPATATTLHAYIHEAGYSESIVCNDNSLIWKLKDAPDNTYLLISAETGEKLQASADAKGIGLNKNYKWNMEWRIATTSAGFFHLKAAGFPNRALSMKRNTLNDYYYFNLYALSSGEPPARLYKRNGSEPAVPDEPSNPDSTQAPTRELSKNGVLTLKGNWSAELLQTLDFTNVRALDLTGITLPESLQAFRQMPKHQNIPIFVHANEAALVPQAWSFVISCNKSGNLLLKNTKLIDAPFFTDRSIQVDQGRLTYTRAVDSQWSTICLPFDATKPNDVEAYAITGISEVNLLCKAIDLLEKDKSYLIRCKTSREAVFTSSSCTLSPTLAPFGNQSMLLRGTFENYLISKNNPLSAYLLNAQGNYFVKAAAGSAIRPYRAALFVPESSQKFGSAPSIAIHHKPHTPLSK